MDQPTKKKEPLATKIGLKEAQSKHHEIIRILLIWGVLYLICVAIRDDMYKSASMDRITDFIKPNTLGYKALMELDENARNKCIASLESIFNQQTGATKKFGRAIRVGLLAGVITEFIINGNTDKPLGVVARTITYSTLLALFG